MSEQIWHPYTQPPDDDRVVMLRFGPDGSHDCQGCYFHNVRAYARSKTRAMQMRFLHPTHWRDLTEKGR